jgi:hypothetical protein
MVPSRAPAIASNTTLTTYAAGAGLWPILVLHTIMLPLNLLRLREAIGSGAVPAMVGAPIPVRSGGW